MQRYNYAHTRILIPTDGSDRGEVGAPRAPATTYRRQRCLCARVRPPAPDPRQGTLVTSRMEVRSALGPAITRAGGIKSKEDDVRS
jgi:hypothetical protein